MGFLERTLTTILQQPGILFGKLFLHGAALGVSLIYIYLWGFRDDYAFQAFSQAIGIQLVALSAVRLGLSTEKNEPERLADFGKLGLIFLGLQLMGQFLLLGDLVLLPAIAAYCILSQRYIAKVVASSSETSPVWRMTHSLIAGLSFAVLNYTALGAFDSHVLNIGIAALFAGAIFSKSTEIAEKAKAATS